jgi:hypothetical protein
VERHRCRRRTAVGGLAGSVVRDLGTAQRELVDDLAGPFGAYQGLESESERVGRREEMALLTELARSCFEAWQVDPSGPSLWRRGRTTSLRP